MDKIDEEILGRYANVLDVFNDYNNKSYTKKDLANKKILNEVCNFCIENEILSKADINTCIYGMKDLLKLSALISLISLGLSLFFSITLIPSIFFAILCWYLGNNYLSIFDNPPLALHKNMSKNYTTEEVIDTVYNEENNNKALLFEGMEEIPNDIFVIDNILLKIENLLNQRTANSISTELQKLYSLLKSLKSKTEINKDIEISEINSLQLIINELEKLIMEYIRIKSVDSLADILEDKILKLIINIQKVVERIGENYIKSQIDSIEAQIDGINMFAEKKKEELRSESGQTFQI